MERNAPHDRSFENLTDIIHSIPFFGMYVPPKPGGIPNPVQHQIMNPRSNEPVYSLPAVQEHVENIKRGDTFTNFE